MDADCDAINAALPVNAVTAWTLLQVGALKSPKAISWSLNLARVSLFARIFREFEVRSKKVMQR